MLSAIATRSAQVIPPSVQPGRERERFIVPQGPRAQPGAAPIGLPSTAAPPEAKTTFIVIRGIRITGATVYGHEEFLPLYQELIGRRVPLQAVYDLAQAITAKYGAAGYVLSRALVPVQELEPSGATVRIEVVEGYVDRVEWPEKLKRYRDFFTDYAAKITADRPLNIRTLERYLLLANDLPGLKFSTTLKASKTAKGAATLYRRGDREAGRMERALRQPRHRAARAAAIPDLADHQQPDGPARGAGADLRERRAVQGAAIHRDGLAPGAQQRGPHRIRQRRSTAGAIRATSPAKSRFQDAQHLRRSRCVSSR